MKVFTILTAMEGLGTYAVISNLHRNELRATAELRDDPSGIHTSITGQIVGVNNAAHGPMFSHDEGPLTRSKMQHQATLCLHSTHCRIDQEVVQALHPFIPTKAAYSCKQKDNRPIKEENALASYCDIGVLLLA